MSDFFRPVIVSAKIDNPVVAAVQSVLVAAQQTIAGLPNLTAESVSLFYGSPAKYPALNPTPEGLTDIQQKQWTLVWKAMSPITSAVMKGEAANARDLGVKLAADVSFWDSVSRVATAVATVGVSEITPYVEEKWREMKGKINEWDATRAWALKIADNKDCPADKAVQIRNRIAELDGSISGKIASLTAQIPGIKDAVKQEGLGGIAALATLAHIKTAVLITAITAVVAIIIYCISSVKSIINDLGLQAIGEAIKTGQKALGPWLGVAIFAGIGFIIYKKFTTPKTILRLSR